MSGALIGGSLGDHVLGDNVVPIPYDGSAHAVSFAVASPPAWMDTSGNITAAGLYRIGISLDPGTPPTTPGRLGLVVVALAESAVPVDAIDALGEVVVFDVVAVASGDLPYAFAATVEVQTDVTGVCDAQGVVTQLASVST